jgi:hypothetical protein
MKKNFETLKKLEQIFIKEELNDLDKELAKKLIMELYESITYPQTEEHSHQELLQNHIDKELERIENEIKDKFEEIKAVFSYKTSENEHKDSDSKPVTEAPQPKGTTETQATAPAEKETTEKSHDTNSQNKEPKSESKSQKTEKIEINKTAEHKQTISEVLSESAPKTVYEIIKDIKNDVDLSTKLANMPVENISKAISLNEKLMFIRELFDGNADKYNEATTKMNNANSLEEALDMLASYDIDTTKESAGVFIKILYRRFL